MKIYLTQSELVELAEKWENDITFDPKYRRPLCAKCGRKIRGRKMWHCWLIHDKYYKEIHLCKRCGKDYRVD